MAHEQHVLVGVDGSPASDAALAWGLDVAARTGRSLEALQAWQWEMGSLGVVVPDAPVALAVAAKHSVEAQLGKALANRPAGSPDVSARARTAEGEAATVLLAASRHSDLLVVGRHGQAAWQRRLVGQTLGAVASQCLNRARVPVVVVPPGVPVGTPRRIVVGVDGSEPSERALAWAVEHGQEVGAPVRAVLTWQLTTLPPPAGAGKDWAVPPLAEWEVVAQDLLARSVERAVGPDAEVDQRVSHRPAAAGLLESVDLGDLLVLGERGRGGFSRLLLGSVSRQCVEHSRCAVVVVPPRDRAHVATAPEQ